MSNEKETESSPEEKPKLSTEEEIRAYENSLVGLQEGYSRANTEQIKIIMKEKKEEAKRAKQESRAEYRNTRRPRRKTRTAVLIFGGLALLAGVTLAAIAQAQNTPTPSTTGEEPVVMMEMTPEEAAKESAYKTLEEIGYALNAYIAGKFGAESPEFTGIQSSMLHEGMVVPSARGESFIFSGELSSVPAAFDVEDAINTLKAPLEEDPFWTFEDITSNPDIATALPEGDTLIKAVKFNGIGYSDDRPTAVAMIFSTEPSGSIRIRVDSSVLIDGSVEQTEETSTEE